MTRHGPTVGGGAGSGVGTPPDRTAALVSAVDAVAAPGDVLATGPGYRWIAYRTDDGTMVAACYVGGLLRRDRRGWWVAGPAGQRRPVADATVAKALGSAPAGWPVRAEQAPLLGHLLLLRGVAS